jgi:hypothetical protein
MADWLPRLNALIAAVVVTIGFTLAWVWTPMPVSWAFVTGLGFTALLLWLGETIRHIWAWACLILGLESLSWSAAQLIKPAMEGVPQPSGEQVVNSFVGIFFATFWLTFAYGIFRLIRRTESMEPPAPKS